MWLDLTKDGCILLYSIVIPIYQCTVVCRVTCGTRCWLVASAAYVAPGISNATDMASMAARPIRTSTSCYTIKTSEAECLFVV